MHKGLYPEIKLWIEKDLSIEGGGSYTVHERLLCDADDWLDLYVRNNLYAVGIVVPNLYDSRRSVTILHLDKLWLKQTFRTFCYVLHIALCSDISLLIQYDTGFLVPF